MSYNNNRNNARPQGQGNHHQAQENIMVGIRTAKQALPYDFLPLDTSKTVTAEQIPHDGSSQQELYSGELRCEMTTLTPLLVGWKKHKEDKDKKNDGVLQPLLHDGRVLIPGTSIKGMIRQRIAMLTNAPMEKASFHKDQRVQQPTDSKKLSIVHRLFGYVDGEQAQAGRVSINFAVEQDIDRNNRWIKRGEKLSLKTLGSPSANSYYKKYKQELFSGELPSARKFYPHQTNTNNERHFEDKQRSINSHASHILEEEANFRFTIRYQDLADWELGLLLIALQPHRLNPTKAQFKDYGLKLGYGRPLGLGSVQIRLCDQKGKELQEIQAFLSEPDKDLFSNHRRLKLSDLAQTAEAFLKRNRVSGKQMADWLLSAQLQKNTRKYPMPPRRY